MTEVVVQGTLRPDGTLELSQPIDLPPGDVRMIVQSVRTLPRDKENILDVLERVWAQRAASGTPSRTGAQVDADIQSMRDEWEEHQEQLERIQQQARRTRE